MFQHKAVIGGKVRLAFSAIDYQSVNHTPGQRRKVYMRWETGATHSDYPGGSDAFSEQAGSGSAIPALAASFDQRHLPGRFL